MTTVNYRNYAIRQDAKGWYFDGLYRDYGYFNTLREVQNAVDEDSCHPDWPLLKYKPNGYQEEGGRAYYLHLYGGWALFIFFPIKTLVPFLIYCHLLMVRVITSILKPDSKKSLILWTGFMSVHIIVIAGIVAITYYATRLPLGMLATYEMSAQAQ